MDNALLAMSADFDALYAQLGRESITLERLLRALLLPALYSIRWERQNVERIEFDLLFRWFLSLGVDDPGAIAPLSDGSSVSLSAVTV